MIIKKGDGVKNSIRFFLVLLGSFIVIMHAKADAIGKGLDSDITIDSSSPQSMSQAQVPQSRMSAVTKYLDMPEGLPANPHCLSGGQPCAEEAQKEADEFKKKRDIQ